VCTPYAQKEYAVDDTQTKIERARQAASKDPTKILEEKYGEGIRAHLAEAFAQPAPSEDPANFKKASAEDEIDPMFSDMPVPPPLSVAGKARRAEVEARLSPIQVDHLFASGEVRQEVQIRPGRLVVTFKTLKTREDLYIKRRISEVSSMDSARYVEDRFLSMLLAAQLAAYNGVELPPFTDKDGSISDAMFNKRLERIMDIPIILLQEIWVNYRWFERRVQDALSAENLKNG
jgi:hypothetical protein